MLNAIPDWLFDLVFTVNRTVHVLAAALLVGGLLFLKLVVPLATADLHGDQQTAVFLHSRRIFRRVVLVSLVALVLSGALSSIRLRSVYQQEAATTGSAWVTALPWMAVHVGLGVLGFALVFHIKRLPDRPMGWIGVKLIILVLAVFMASAARHVELQLAVWLKPTPFHVGDRMR